MRCRKAQRYVSFMIDDQLSSREAVRLERHLEKCGECRAMAEDFRVMAGAAAKLDPPEPADNAWRGIRAKLAAADTEPARTGFATGRRTLFGAGVPALRYAGAAALAVALVVTGVIVGLRLGREDAPAARGNSEAYTLAKLDEAERHYLAAIQSLNEAFAAGKEGQPPQVVELFDRSLSVIDATIQACRRAVFEEPDDLEARSYLLAAYTRKVTLLDSALDLQRSDRDAAGGKTIL
jgi:hypothetical protein